MTKLISWNVNGLRACAGKGFLEFFREADADIFCLQETKLQAGQIELDLPGYHQFWNYAEKKGYSGTALFTKEEPVAVTYGIGVPEHDREGRVITAEYPEYYVVTCYTPNSQNELARLSYRMEWEDAWRAYLGGLKAKKPVVICGDFNVAHQEIDLKNPKTNRKMPGSPTRSAGNSPNFWNRALSIPTAIFIRIRRASTRGGRTALKPGRRTPDGASTISVSQRSLRTGLPGRRSTRRSWARIIARWN